MRPMISALCWLPRGAAKALEETPDAKPEAAELAEQEGQFASPVSGRLLPNNTHRYLEFNNRSMPEALLAHGPAEDQRSTDSEEASDEENQGQAVARARAAASALRAGTGKTSAVKNFAWTVTFRSHMTQHACFAI